MYIAKRPNIVRNFDPDLNVSYDGFQIFHVAGPKIWENIEFINNDTISLTFRGSAYSIRKVDRMIFLMSNLDFSENPKEGRCGVAFQIIIDAVATIQMVDDHYSVYQGTTLVIPIAQILANDTDIITNGQMPLILNGISNPVGGNITINGSNIEFTNTAGEIGDICSFTYEARNDNGDVATAQVLIEIMPLPPIICNPDTFDIQQGETILLSKASLSDNDVDGLGLTLTVTDVANPKAGVVSLNGDNISFTSTGVSGFPAEFEYTVQNTQGTQGTGKVYFNVTPLPPIEGLVYTTATEVQTAITSGYTPPTVQDIFNSWPRFDGANYYTDYTTGSTNAKAWQLLSNPDRILMPLNVSPGNGFVSPESFSNYTFQATLFSDNADNDTIGLIAAFKRDGTVNKALIAARTKAGTQPSAGWGFLYSENGAQTWVINNLVSGDAAGGWSSQKTGVKIQRQGDIITAYSTNWNDETNFQVTSKIVLDLNSDPRLAVFKDTSPYGYYTYSQPNSTYLDASFTGGLDASKMFDATNNTTWEYQNGQWIDTGVTLQESLGYVREVTNPETGVTYIIKANEILIKE